ncbi:MAG: Ldh family oxidoreductase, partial [Minwuiales bacterium]|nr:Ldh family oxidoreductase [Minwuiales bacterium]
GEHKGYGLAFICELLAGALTGGGTCLPERESEEIIINNMLSILIDPTATGNAEGYAREIDAMTAHVKASPPAPGVEAVMVPGDPERKSRAERGANGIPVDDRTWEEIVETAGKVGIAANEVNAAA